MRLPLALLALVSMVAACGDGGSGDGPPAEPGADYSLWLSAEQVPPGDVAMVAVLVNHTGVEATFGVLTTVQRWDGEGWRRVGDVVMCLDHWHCTAEVGEADFVPDIGLGASRGRPGSLQRFSIRGLDAAWYRITSEANEGVVATGVFEIVDGADPPAPLLDVDVAGISVSPSLVDPDGQRVRLDPLVPPSPEGSLSVDDVERAVEGLSETAQIERWEGEAWQPVGAFELEREEGGWGSAPRGGDVPALEPGEYRVVRAGPGASHIGRFWVDDVEG